MTALNEGIAAITIASQSALAMTRMELAFKSSDLQPE
jgi:hypothetical protein